MKLLTYCKPIESHGTVYFFNSYSCLWPKKLMVSKADLSTQTDMNVKTNITTTCKATGDYDIDINDYTCTKPCPLPRLSDPLLMTHNWTNTTENAEYKDVMRYFSSIFLYHFI